MKKKKAGKGKKKIRAAGKITREIINPESIYTVFDKLDDQQIIQSIQGEALKDYVYSFEDKKTGRMITQLSKVGVDMACSALAKKNMIIREMDLQFTDTGEDALFISKAGRFEMDRKSGREILLDVKIGQKRQPKKMEIHGKGGSSYVVENKFWFEQGGQKALRNARRDLMPANFIARMIAEWIKSGNVKQLNSGDVKPEAKQETKPVAEVQAGKGKILLPEISASSVCDIGKYQKTPMVWRKIPLADLLYFQEQAQNPEKLAKMIRERMGDLMRNYMKLLGGGMAGIWAMIKRKFQKDNEGQLTQAEYISLLRDLKKLWKEKKEREEGVK